jgi:hypothetical protein
MALEAAFGALSGRNYDEFGQRNSGKSRELCAAVGCAAKCVGI